MKYLATDHPEYFQSPYKVLAIPIYGEMSVADVIEAIEDEANGSWDFSDEQYAEIDEFVANLRLAYEPDEVFIEDPGYEEPIGDMETPLYAYFHFEND